MAVKQKSKKNIKKGFFDVETSLVTTKIQLYGSSQEEFVGKTIKIDLTKNLRGKGLVLTFRIKEENGKLKGFPEKIQLENSYIQRVMRRGTDYVEDSFQAPCRDSISRIKPLLVTRRRVSRAVLNSLRETTRKSIESYVKTRNAHEVISDIMTNKLQKNIIPKLKKIYPLALCEIRTFEIESALEESAKPAEEIVSEN